MKIKTVLQLVIRSHSIPYGDLNEISNDLVSKYGDDIECTKLRGHYVIAFVNRNIPTMDIVKITSDLIARYSRESIYLRTSLQFLTEKDCEELESRSIFRVSTNKQVHIIKNVSRRCNCYNNNAIVGTYINQKDEEDEISFRTLVLLYRQHPKTGKIKYDYVVYDHADPVVGFYKSSIHKQLKGKGLYKLKEKIISSIKNNVKDLNIKYQNMPLPLLTDTHHFFTLDISKYSFGNNGDLT